MSPARQSEPCSGDGAVFGIVGLLVVLCLAVGSIYHWPLLFAHAITVLLYVQLVALRTGYGFVYLWPDEPVLDNNLAILTRAALGVAVIGYLHLLLQVRRFPRYWGHLISAWQILLVLYGLGQILLGGVLLNNVLSWSISGVSALLMLLVTWIGHRQRLRYNWFCYLFSSVLALQMLIQTGFVFKLWSLSIYEYSWYSMSTLPGAAFLLYTLVSRATGATPGEARVAGYRSVETDRKRAARAYRCNAYQPVERCTVCAESSVGAYQS